MTDDIYTSLGRLEGRLDGLEKNNNRHEEDMRRFSQEAGVAIQCKVEIDRLWDAVRSLRTDQEQKVKLERESKRWRINTYFLVASLLITLALGISTLVLK